MKPLTSLLKRNIKLFFRDKGLFFTSLITPMILLVLYATFLGNVYRDSFIMAIPEQFLVPEELIDGTVACQLFSSLLAVCCVTVAFCSNMLTVQDKMTGARQDMRMTPLKPSLMGLGYYLSTLISTLCICFAATAVCLLYVATQGWYVSAVDLLLLVGDLILLVMFGTVLSSIVNLFLSSQGQISAVGTIVSSGYGFVCGAYMPIAQFPDGLQTVLSFLPGTYGTSLLRNHAMRGALCEMEAIGIPADMVESIKDSIDCNLYFFDHLVEPWQMAWILGGSVVLLMGVYLLLCFLRGRREAK